MMNMMNMMKQAQNIQKRLKDAQEELNHMEISGEAANGAVKVICDGKGLFKSIKLSAEAINPEDPSSVSEDSIEMLVVGKACEVRNFVDFVFSGFEELYCLLHPAFV